MKHLIKKILKEEQDLEWAKDIISGPIRPTRSLIIKPDAPATLKNAIETRTEVMHGDADSYDNDTVIYYRDAKGRWGNDDWDADFNFDDFERVVEFLKGNHQIDWDDDEETEFFLDAGVIDWDEYADNGFETGTINEVFYYDDKGNKYKATIDGISTYHDDDDHDDDEDEDEDEDYDDEYCEECGEELEDGFCPNCDDDEDEEDEEECEICGDYDDTGTGICSDCEDDEDDEDDDDE